MKLLREFVHKKITKYIKITGHLQDYIAQNYMVFVHTATLLADLTAL